MCGRSIVGFVVLTMASTCLADVVGPKTPATQRAMVLVGLLSTGDFAGAVRGFDTTMTGALPAPALQSAWQSVQAQAGPFRRPVGVSEQRQAGFVVVLVTCEFERATLDVKVAYDRADKVAGLFFVPTGSTPSYEPPPYADGTKFEERDVVVDAGGWPLPGTLTVPVGPGPFRAAVLVHGSGPNDRDETIGPNKPFKDLAWGLATRGLAVLRYDKRTLVHGQRVVQHAATFTVDDETVADAVAAVGLLRRTATIDGKRVFVVGHSLGGMLAPRIAQQVPDLGGIVIMAGLTRKVEDTMLDQFEYIFRSDGTVTADEQQKLDEVRAAVAAIKALPAIDGQLVAALEKDLAEIKAEDSRWREKKTALDNAPRPFPAAGMTSASLEAEMQKILKDRGIGPVEKLVIVDKDWWVQQGEFRYLKAAALQKDGEGPFFTYVTFRQMATLAGYGPTELWEQGKKYRIAP